MDGLHRRNEQWATQLIRMKWLDKHITTLELRVQSAQKYLKGETDAQVRRRVQADINRTRKRINNCKDNYILSDAQVDECGRLMHRRDLFSRKEVRGVRKMHGQTTELHFLLSFVCN